MIGHQGVQIQTNVVKPNALGEFIEKILPIPIRTKDGTTLITTNGYMVDGTFITNTQGTSHDQHCTVLQA